LGATGRNRDGGILNISSDPFFLKNHPMTQQMKLKSSDSELIGKWTLVNDTVQSDETCDRIEWLTKHHLRKIASSEEWGHWEILFQDPEDGRFWELTYPQSEMQGGGPPRLNSIGKERAQAKYRLG
jgi:hypothetical protein